jgi:hypothetical protein
MALLGMAKNAMKWLKSKKCPWDEFTFKAAASNGNLENMKWLKSKECPWDEDTFEASAFMHAIFIKNRSIREGKNVTPIEECFKIKESMENVKVFGCHAEYWVPSEKREKLEEKTKTAIYLGTSDSCNVNELNMTRKGYRLYDIEEFKIIYSRDVRFFENEFPYRDSKLVVLNMSYNDIFSSKNKTEWKEAIEAELKAHEINKTWEIVPRPEGVKLVNMKWVLTEKRKADGSFDKFKARLVARGFTRSLGTDYDVSYCPTPKLGSIRLLLMIALQKSWNVVQLDIKSAFLNGVLDKPVYCKPAEGIAIREGNVLCLKKALYGLQEAGRQWFQTYKSFIETLGFSQSNQEPCCFIKLVNQKSVYIIIYVDDQMLIGEEELVKSTINDIENKFETSSSGELSSFLGMRFVKYENDYAINQKGMIIKLIEKFEMNDAKGSKIPLGSGNCDPDSSECDNNMYRQLIGSLMYIALSTRPDIMFAVSWLSRFLCAATNHHWKEVKRVIRYLKETINFSLNISSMKSKCHLVVHSDADFANADDKKSTSGGIVTLDGTLLTWFSRKQNLTALSTTESEFIALGESVREMIYWKNLLKEFGISPSKCIIRCDSQSCIKISLSEGINGRTKHFGVIVNRIRDHIKINDFEIEYTQSDLNIADIMTKALGRNKFESLRNRILNEQVNAERECEDISVNGPE